MTRVRAHLVRTAVLLAAVTIVNFFLPRWLPGSPLQSHGGGESAVLPQGERCQEPSTAGVGLIVTHKYPEGGCPVGAK